jgi:hypothetical protein
VQAPARSAAAWLVELQRMEESMKTVRLITGAVGMAPLALGVALPATHAPGPIKARASGKTVSLTSARINQPAVANGCTTSRTFSIPPSGNLRGGGWQGDHDVPHTGSNICVGTQVASIKFNAGSPGNPSCKYAWVSQHMNSLFGANFSYNKPAHKYICASHHPVSKIYNFAINKTWANSGLGSSLRVNMFSTHNTGGTGQWLN